MRSLARRIAPLALTAVLLGTLVPAAIAGSPDTSGEAVSAAERAALDRTNRERAVRGLVALRWDERIADLARERAEYMASTGRFSHSEADGTDVFDMIRSARITWYAAGEIIAWNTAGELDSSADFAVDGWLGSSGHRAIVLSKGYNYVGFGVAVDPSTGKRYWAGVYLKGPDRTGAYAKFTSWSKRTIDSRRARVTVRFSGADTRLQVLTSGFAYYQVQRRRPGGDWYTYDVTTSTSLTRTWIRGVTYEVRVRARDKAGNWGSWRTITIKA